MDQIIRFIGLDLGSCCKYLYEVETTLGARPRGIRKGFDLDWIGIGPKRCEHFKSVRDRKLVHCPQFDSLFAVSVLLAGDSKSDPGPNAILRKRFPSLRIISRQPSLQTTCASSLTIFH